MCRWAANVSEPSPVDIRSQAESQGNSTMNRKSLISILLTTAMIAQVVVAGWGHSHVHLADDQTNHTHLQQHEREGHGHDNKQSPQPTSPTDKEGCSICWHLATAAIVSLQLELPTCGDAVKVVQPYNDLLSSTFPIGLYRPRSPPALS
jgi:hypothetical protein